MTDLIPSSSAHCEQTRKQISRELEKQLGENEFSIHPVPILRPLQLNSRVSPTFVPGETITIQLICHLMHRIYQPYYGGQTITFCSAISKSGYNSLIVENSLACSSVAGITLCTWNNLAIK